MQLPRGPCYYRLLRLPTFPVPFLSCCWWVTIKQINGGGWPWVLEAGCSRGGRCELSPRLPWRDDLEDECLRCGLEFEHRTLVGTIVRQMVALGMAEYVPPPNPKSYWRPKGQRLRLYG